MPSPILFYFDLCSPYGYLGSLGVEQVAARCGRIVEWRPILLGISVLQVMGLKPLPETPLKKDYVAHDIPRLARLMAVPYRADAPAMHPLAAMRAFVWLDDQDPAQARRLAQAVFHAHWAQGRDMSAAPAVAELAAGLGHDPGQVLVAIASPAIKARLRARVDAALAAGIFGVPSFVVDGEVFWGADRLPMLERWMTTGGW